MPTFDFKNIIDKIVQGAIASISNPFIVIAALTVAIYGLLSHFTDLGSIFEFPEIQPLEVFFTTEDHNAMLDLVLYVVDFQNLYYFYSVISIATVGFINFMIVFSVSCIGAISIFMSYNSIRRALKDYT